MESSAPHDKNLLLDFVLPLVCVLVLLIVIGMAVILHIHSSDIDRSLSDRVLLLEKQMHERVIPRINIERATVYNGEGDITIEKVEKEKRK